MDYLVLLESEELLDSGQGPMEHERSVVLFPPDKQDEDTDVDDGNSDKEDDPAEQSPEQDADALPRGIFLAKAELQRGRPNIIKMSGMGANE